MSSPRKPLAPFDDEVFASVAAETGVDESRLRDLARRHQEGVRDLPGVDDIVYEWRNQFHQDPLLHRKADIYVLALRAHVWEELGDQLDATETELTALRTLHERQARTLVTDDSRLGDDDAVVLSRP